jgi:hypothetical protein
MIPPKIILPLALLAASAAPAHAFLDVNENGVSDIWERAYNGGELFLTFNPNGDPDGDGWTNAQEAIAGTNPFDATGPLGIVKASVAQHPSIPSVFTVSWKPVPGKVSHLLVSPDLENWTTFDSFPSSDTPIVLGINATDEEDIQPDKLFWRVSMDDKDSVGKGLTDYELKTLGMASGFPDSNLNGRPDPWEAENAGTFAVYPPVLAEKLTLNQTSASSIYLSNDTASAVDYSVEVTGNWGPAYSFEKSGVDTFPFVWEDISTTGTELTTITKADDKFEYAPFGGGFTFPFYGNTYTGVYVSTNGLLTFGAGSTAYNNKVIPHVEGPPNFIAVFWDDLSTTTTGDIYYKQETDRFIVQFQSLQRASSSGSLTFQAVLYPDGRIELRYHTLNGFKNLCSVGVQNGDRTEGLQVVYDAYYLTAGMAVEIKPQANFLTGYTTTGTVPAHSGTTLAGLFRGSKLPPGVYNAHVLVTHNGTGPSPVEIPARLEIGNLPSSIELISPNAGATVLENNNVYLQALASDPEGMAAVHFYDGLTKITEVPLALNYGVTGYKPAPGVRTFTARAIDIHGVSTESNPITVTIIADSDHDGMSDEWEIQEGLDPHDPSDASLRITPGGPTNLQRFQAEFSP